MTDFTHEAAKYRILAKEYLEVAEQALAACQEITGRLERVSAMNEAACDQRDMALLVLGELVAKFSRRRLVTLEGKVNLDHEGARDILGLVAAAEKVLRDTAAAQNAVRNGQDPRK